MTTKITIGDQPVNAVYSDLAGTTSGAGAGSLFNVAKTDGDYTVTLATDNANQGTGYVAGDTILITGDLLGGVAGANDLTIRVLTVGLNGAIATFEFEGVGRVGDGIVDVKVDVSGTEGIDAYEFGGDSTDYTFEFDEDTSDIIVTSSLLPNVQFDLDDHERIAFNDKSYAFDSEAANVYAILGAALGQDDITSELVGAGLHLKEQGMTDLEVAATLLNTDAYKEDAGGISNETFIKHVFYNIFGVQATVEQVLTLVDVMDQYDLTQAQVLVVASNVGVFRDAIDLVGVQQAGIEFTPYVGP